MKSGFLKRFTVETDGAVTVDWVVLTAALVGLGVFVVNLIAAGAMDTSSGVGAHLSSLSLRTY